MDGLSPGGATLLSALHRSGSPLPCCCCHGSQASQAACVVFRCRAKASRGASKRSVFPFLANTRRRYLSQSFPMSRCTRPWFSSFLRRSFIPLVYRNSFSALLWTYFTCVLFPQNRNKISEKRNHYQTVSFRECKYVVLFSQIDPLEVLLTKSEVRS